MAQSPAQWTGKTQGKTSPDIATILGITESTVKKHRQPAFCCDNRTCSSIYFFRYSLLTASSIPEESTYCVPSIPKQLTHLLTVPSKLLCLKNSNRRFGLAITLAFFCADEIAATIFWGFNICDFNPERVTGIDVC